MRIHRLASLGMILIGALALSACEASTPSHVSVGKIRVHDQMVAKTLDAGHVDPARVSTIADHFMRAGKGDMVLNVSYCTKDPSGKARAAKQGATYRNAFKQHGVENFSVVTVPIADQRYAGKAVVTYNALAATPPPGCGDLPGYQGTENLETINEYRFGCETRAALSRMIADPSDLMGKAGTQKNDSRRSGPIIEPYKAGTPNQQLKGYQASGIGG